jgi:ABC-type antimicrobial peptide transport system permease subunit
MPVAAGAVVGIGGTLLLSRALAVFLYDVAPSDPASLAASAIVLLGAAVLAAFVPALQASRTSPAESLRAE